MELEFGANQIECLKHLAEGLPKRIQAARDAIFHPTKDNKSNIYKFIGHARAMEEIRDPDTSDAAIKGYVNLTLNGYDAPPSKTVMFAGFTDPHGYMPMDMRPLWLEDLALLEQEPLRLVAPADVLHPMLHDLLNEEGLDATYEELPETVKLLPSINEIRTAMFRVVEDYAGSLELYDLDDVRDLYAFGSGVRVFCAAVHGFSHSLSTDFKTQRFLLEGVQRATLHLIRREMDEERSPDQRISGFNISMAGALLETFSTPRKTRLYPHSTPLRPRFEPVWERSGDEGR